MAEKYQVCSCGGLPPRYRPLARITPRGRCYCTHCNEIYVDGKPSGERIAPTELAPETGVKKGTD